MRPAGAVPPPSAAMMRGDRRARGASRRMCRSPLFSRSAISAKDARPAELDIIDPGASLGDGRQQRLKGFPDSSWPGRTGPARCLSAAAPFPRPSRWVSQEAVRVAIPPISEPAKAEAAEGIAVSICAMSSIGSACVVPEQDQREKHFDSACRLGPHAGRTSPDPAMAVCGQ